jgi:hypothetical protein
MIPGFNVDPFCVFFGIALRYLPTIIDGKAEMSHILPVRSGAGFRVFAEMIDRLKSISSRHIFSLFPG